VKYDFISLNKFKIMTFKELEPGIKILNNNFKGKIMQPCNLPIKEFIAAPDYEDKIVGFHMAYSISKGNNKKALTKFQNEPLAIYAVFNQGKLSDQHGLDSYVFTKLPLFYQSNQIDPNDLIRDVLKN
jgi:hypothetical protein